MSERVLHKKNCMKTTIVSVNILFHFTKKCVCVHDFEYVQGCTVSCTSAHIIPSRLISIIITVAGGLMFSGCLSMLLLLH